VEEEKEEEEERCWRSFGKEKEKRKENEGVLTSWAEGPLINPSSSKKTSSRHGLPPPSRPIQPSSASTSISFQIFDDLVEREESHQPSTDQKEQDQEQEEEEEDVTINTKIALNALDEMFGDGLEGGEEDEIDQHLISSTSLTPKNNNSHHQLNLSNGEVLASLNPSREPVRDHPTRDPRGESLFLGPNFDLSTIPEQG